MSEQLLLDFDPAETAADATRDAAFDDLVSTVTVTVTDARTHDLHCQLADDETVTVWICPACGAWEANEFLLENNHGIGREYLVQWDNGEWANNGAYYGRRWCVALDLTANHATYGDGHLDSDQKAMLTRLRPEVKPCTSTKRGPGPPSDPQGHRCLRPST